MSLTITRARGVARKSKFMNEDEAAAFIGISPRKLRRLGYERKGPRFLKLGRDHLFAERDLVKWLAAQRG
jgi:hypothetical protein